MKVFLLSTVALIATGCACTQPHQQQTTTQQQSPTPGYQQTTQQSNWVGDRGPDGPAGARGARGEAGQAGPAGYAVAGERGPAGATGPAGERGAAGAQGQAGTIVRGPTGEVGPAGSAGAQGPIGQTGTRGTSAAGAAGPAGPDGPRGPVGPTGATGERGERLVGPTGAAGRPGVSGERGAMGQQGATGTTTAGVAGPVGVAGPAGPRGDIGPMGPVGPTGIVETWAAYREFWFDENMTQYHDADRYQVAELASYLRANPTLQVGIDNWAAAGTNQNLRDGRINAIRRSLIDAGVPSNSIVTGSFSDASHHRDGRIGVLLRTDRDAHAQAANRLAQGHSDDRSPAQPAVTESWRVLQSLRFDANTSALHTADSEKVEEITAYMRDNPSLQLGIDSTLDRNNPNQSSSARELARSRGEAVRMALIAAGVPEARIASGEFGDVRQRRDGWVEVLVRTQRLSQGRE